MQTPVSSVRVVLLPSKTGFSCYYAKEFRAGVSATRLRIYLEVRLLQSHRSGN
jgi:hypothetical protein